MTSLWDRIILKAKEEEVIIVNIRFLKSYFGIVLSWTYKFSKIKIKLYVRSSFYCIFITNSDNTTLVICLHRQFEYICIYIYACAWKCGSLLLLIINAIFTMRFSRTAFPGPQQKTFQIYRSSYFFIIDFRFLSEHLSTKFTSVCSQRI